MRQPQPPGPSGAAAEVREYIPAVSESMAVAYAQVLFRRSLDFVLRTSYREQMHQYPNNHGN